MARIIVQTPGHIQREPALQSMNKLVAVMFAAAVLPACVELDDEVSSTEDDITCVACTSTSLIVNGGFETADGWKLGGDAVLYNDATYSRTGTSFGYLGASVSSHPSIEQSVTIPSAVGSATLRWYLNVWSGNEFNGDPFLVQVCANDGCHLVGGSSSSMQTPVLDYKAYHADLSAYRGQTVTIRFSATEDQYIRTSYMIDDVSLTTTPTNSL